MDSECVICKCEMESKQFDSEKEEGSEKDCFRLNCKHAFHAKCIIQSFRISGKACPICRDGQETDDLVQIQVHTNNLNFTLNVNPQDLIEIDDTEVESPSPIYNSLMCNDTQVKAAKTNFNVAIKSYNIFKDKLRLHRRKTLTESLKSFRSTYYKQFLIEKEKVRQTLDTFKKEVTKKLQDREPIHFYSITELLQEPKHEWCSSRKQDPMKKTFWHY